MEYDGEKKAYLYNMMPRRYEAPTSQARPRRCGSVNGHPQARLPVRGKVHGINHEKLRQFADQKYLNLETYRRNGTPVATPMWFAEHDGLLYVYSRATGGKVKRISQHPQVRVVPCTAGGTPTGEWVGGTSRILDEPDATLGHQRLTAKYGWLKRVGDLISRVRHRARVVMAIEVG